jgi:predicted molibdopterin-dependent oxidoreductase YjgC
MADWRIVCDVATAMGHAMDSSNVGEITDELARVSPLYVDLTHESLDGRGWLVRRKGEPRALEPATIPHLGVERLLFHTGTTSRHAAALLKICPQATAKLGFGLASELGLGEGDRVRLSTSQGSVTVPIEIDPSIGDHGVLLSNHFEGQGALELFDYALDPVTKAPGLEGCEVSVEKEEVAEE